MNTAFADTFYYLALISEDDAAHERAVELSRTLHSRIVTTAWILTEVADALATGRQRDAFGILFERLRADPSIMIVPPTQVTFEQGINLYLQRSDKAWSLTDCISFVVMQQNDISEALTGDHHFEQAGFNALLK